MLFLKMFTKVVAILYICGCIVIPLSLFLNAPHNIKYENMNKNKGVQVLVYVSHAACRQFAAINISSGLETPPPQIIILLRSLSAGKAISAAGHPPLPIKTIPSGH